MPPAPPDSGTDPGYTKAAGLEPLPGYRLIEPLGRGGFGEVWKCVAPGGLHKAVKFVSAESGDGEGGQFRQELAAFEQIKAIRHPFLLTLERVEVIGTELIMVMELADRQLADRFQECRDEGRPGIPREELLGYFAEAAEALDLISNKYGLQHLDVKPANLFLTAGHVKVGDYGLVSRLDGTTDAGVNRGLTPKYVAPEVLRGEVHTRSDQYSLALVYFELLTGGFPYKGRTAQQLMIQHVSIPPDVSALPPCDHTPVWVALQKKPEDRFPTCRAFVRALQDADPTGQVPAPAAPTQLAGGGTSTMAQLRAGRPTLTTGELTGRYPQPSELTARMPRPGELSGRLTPPEDAEHEQTVRLPAPGTNLPGLVTVNRSSESARMNPPPSREPAPPLSSESARMPAPGAAPADDDLPLAEPASDRVRVKPIRSVLAVAALRGESTRRPPLSATDFIAVVMTTAAAGGRVPEMPGELGRLADGTWVSRFPSTVPPQVAALKMGLLRERWGVAVDTPGPTQIVLRKLTQSGGRLFGFSKKKKAGLEVRIDLPAPGRSVWEVTVSGGAGGDPDPGLVQLSEDLVPKIIADVRRELGNVEDRRKHPRVPTTLPVTAYPLHSDGTVEPPVAGTCRDVSVGGIGFVTEVPLGTRYAYVAFDGIPAVAGFVVLTKVLRSQTLIPGPGQAHGAQFRTDL